MTIIRRIVGLLLMIAAVIGLIFSIGALVAVWQAEPTLSTGLQNGIALLSQTMETTADGLVVTQDALKSSVATVGNLQSTLETTATTMESADPLLSEIVRLMNEELPSTIAATQQSLNTAQSSAQVIDGLLASLSGIPLIGSSIGYEPEVPLSEALGQVADSLDGLPDSFANMETSLRDTQSNIQTFQADMSTMAASVGQIQSSVAEYERVVSGYQESIDQIKAQLNAVSASVPQGIRAALLGLTVFLVWMAIAQLGLFTQGWELLTESVRREVTAELVDEQVVVIDKGDEVVKIEEEDLKVEHEADKEV